MTDESGSGMVGSVVGVTAFLALLLFAVQLALNLYATSTLTAVAFDAARIVAGADGGPMAEADAEAHVRSLLGADPVAMAWEYRDTDAQPGADVVALTVEVEHPTRLLAAMPIPFQHVIRTVTVRMETFRP